MRLSSVKTHHIQRAPLQPGVVHGFAVRTQRQRALAERVSLQTAASSHEGTDARRQFTPQIEP